MEDIWSRGIYQAFLDRIHFQANMELPQVFQEISLVDIDCQMEIDCRKRVDIDYRDQSLQDIYQLFQDIDQLES